jgi:hypothetical protein
VFMLAVWGSVSTVSLIWSSIHPNFVARDVMKLHVVTQVYAVLCNS